MKNIKNYLAVFLIFLAIVSCSKKNSKDSVKNLKKIVKYLKIEKKYNKILKENYKAFFKNDWNVYFKKNIRAYPVKNRASIFVPSESEITFSFLTKNDCKHRYTVEIFKNGKLIDRVYTEKKLEKKYSFSSFNQPLNLLFLVKGEKKELCFPFYIKNIGIKPKNLKVGFYGEKLEKKGVAYLMSGEELVLPLKQGEKFRISFRELTGNPVIKIFKKNISREELIKEIGFKNRLSESFSYNSSKDTMIKFKIENGEGKFSVAEIKTLYIEREERLEDCLKSYKRYKDKNIVLVLLDAARYDVIGKNFYSKKIIPFLDRLGKNSIYYKNFYSIAPYTPPSITSMFTGLYPEEHAVFSKFDRLDNSIKTIAYYLKRAGYRTIGFYGNFIFSLCKVNKDFDISIPIKDIGKRESLNYSFNDIEKALKILNKFKNSKFFAYFHILPPHEPYNPPKKFKIFLKNYKYNFYFLRKKFELLEAYKLEDKDFIKTVKKLYLNNYYYADYISKRIYSFLEGNNLLKNTIFIVTADHGEAFFEHEKFRHSTTLYNEMIHIPLIIKLPGMKRGKEVETFYSNIQLFSTLLQFAGFSYRKYNAPPPIALNNCMANFVIYSRAQGLPIHSAVVYSGYKYIYSNGLNELYDISEDEEEKNNLFNKDDFLSLYLKRMLFETFYKHKKDRVRKYKRKFSKKELNELKSLGYL